MEESVDLASLSDDMVSRLLGGTCELVTPFFNFPADRCGNQERDDKSRGEPMDLNCWRAFELTIPSTRLLISTSISDLRT